MGSGLSLRKSLNGRGSFTAAIILIGIGIVAAILYFVVSIPDFKKDIEKLKEAKKEKK